jgi:hypothetical protein
MPNRRDGTCHRSASVACGVPSRSQPVQVCAPASAMPCPAQRSSASALLCSWRRANRSTSSHFPRSLSSFLSASHTHTVFLPGPASQSSPRIARRKRKKRKDKGRHHHTPTPPPCLLLVKPFVSWRASATHAVRVASQTNAPTHTATSTGHQWFASRLTASPSLCLLLLPPMSDSNHVLRYAHPHQTPHRSTCRHGEGPPLGATDPWAWPAGTPETERGEKKRKVPRTVQYATQEGDLSLSFLPVVKAEPWGQPASPSPTRSGGARPASVLAGSRDPSRSPPARPSVRPSARCYKYTARHPPRSRSLPSPPPLSGHTYGLAILCSLLRFPAATHAVGLRLRLPSGTQASVTSSFPKPSVSAAGLPGGTRRGRAWTGPDPPARYYATTLDPAVSPLVLAR